MVSQPGILLTLCILFALRSNPRGIYENNNRTERSSEPAETRPERDPTSEYVIPHPHPVDPVRVKTEKVSSSCKPGLNLGSSWTQKLDPALDASSVKNFYDSLSYSLSYSVVSLRTLVHAASLALSPSSGRNAVHRRDYFRRFIPTMADWLSHQTDPNICICTCVLTGIMDHGQGSSRVLIHLRACDP